MPNNDYMWNTEVFVRFMDEYYKNLVDKREKLPLTLTCNVLHHVVINKHALYYLIEGSIIMKWNNCSKKSVNHF